MGRWRTYICAAVLAAAPLELGGQSPADRLWAVAPGDDPGPTIDQILDDRPAFQELFDALAEGPGYRADVATGRIELERRNQDGTLHRYFIVVPSGYDPGRRYPVRVYLHGGVSRPAQEQGGSWWRRWERLADPNQIAVFPASWNESLWWQRSQLENLRGILAELKGTYNVDESRIHLFGVSDGGTGAYYVAVKDPTPWAAFLPFIGHAAVLMNPKVGVEGEFHPVNLINSPLYVVNGETDRLYPVRSVRPWIDAWRGVGVDVVFRAKPTGHDVSWWSDEAPDIDRFLESRPRTAHPESVVWAVEPWAPETRAWWVVVEELDPGGGEPQSAGGRTGSDMTGVVQAQRTGNGIELSTDQVQRVRLLLSPQVFDFSRPIVVKANDDVVFEGTVEADPRVLLSWAARDRDRTMLYGAELVLDVAPRPSAR